MQIMLLGSGQQYGDEIVSNGSFGTSADWTVPAGWTISGGKANHVSGIGVLQGDLNEAFYQSGNYEVTYTVSGYSGSGGVYVSLGSFNGTTRSANGTYTEVITLTGGDSFTVVNINPASAATFSIDNLTVRRKYY